MPQPNVSGAAVQMSFGLFSSFLATTVRLPTTKIYGTNTAPSSRPPTYEKECIPSGMTPSVVAVFAQLVPAAEWVRLPTPPTLAEGYGCWQRYKYRIKYPIPSVDRILNRLIR